MYYFCDNIENYMTMLKNKVTSSNGGIDNRFKPFSIALVYLEESN